METQEFHVVKGNVTGIVLDVITGDINGLAMGATYLATINGTTPYGQSFGQATAQYSFEPLLIQLEVASATGVISVPTITIGTNAPNYNNILNTMTLTGLSTAGVRTVTTPSPGSVRALYGSDVYANVTNVGVGTELTLSIDLIGSFQP